jgi:hypothetical protein
MERQKSSLFEEEKGSFERTKGKQKRYGLLQPVSGLFHLYEKSNFFAPHLTFHGNGLTPLFQKRKAQNEKCPKIRKCS